MPPHIHVTCESIELKNRICSVCTLSTAHNHLFEQLLFTFDRRREEPGSLMLYIWHPVAPVFGHEIASSQQNNVNNPPNSNASYREQFTDSGSRVSQTEPIHTEEAQQERIQKCRCEIVTRVSEKKIEIISSHERRTPLPSFRVAFHKSRLGLEFHSQSMTHFMQGNPSF